MLQSFVVHSAELARMDKEFFPRLQLVCEEAFVYVLSNSFDEGEEDFVKVQIDIKNSYFRLSFFDKGLPFDSSLSQDYHIDDFSTDGLELFLIKEYSDSVEWINHGSEGKEFRLSFEIPSRDIFAIEQTVESKDRVENLQIEDIDIRGFKPDDAIKISRIIYRAYGYTYPNEDMYYPEKILNLNQNGELISIVSYDKKSDEIIGHYALERPDLGAVAESGQAVVSPQSRGLGLMKKMRNLLESSAEKLGLEGIVSQPVTSHTFSQQVNEGFGSSPYGFSFGLVPQKLSFKQIHQTLSQRESCMLYFKDLKSRDRALYIPSIHKQMIENIYADIAIEYTNAKEMSEAKSGRVTSNYSSNWGIGVINVYTIAEDNFSQIKEALYNLLFSLKAEVVFLNITLEDATIDKLVAEVESEKFFFAGIHPSLLDGADAVRLEYLNGVIDESKIQIYSDRARELFEYVLTQKRRALG
jgi:anti-sigma regulatory factor (Ser/Thr protein kinase)